MYQTVYEMSAFHLYKIFLSTMYQFHSSLISRRFMISAVIQPTSFSRSIWPPVSLSSHTARSRNVSAHLAPGCRICLQVYPWLNRWRWVTCLQQRPPARPRGNPSRPDWRSWGPGPAIVLQGRGAVMWGSGIVLLCHRWLQAVFGDGALEWHKSSGTALPGISLSNYNGGNRNKEPLT